MCLFVYCADYKALAYL